MRKDYNENTHPHHPLVKTAVAKGLIDVKFWWGKKENRQSNCWHLECRQVPYKRFYGSVKQVIEQVHNGTLIDEGRGFQFFSIFPEQ